MALLRSLMAPAVWGKSVWSKACVIEGGAGTFLPFNWTLEFAVQLGKITKTLVMLAEKY